MIKIFLAFALVCSSLALYEADSPVFKLTEANFKKSVLESD